MLEYHVHKKGYSAFVVAAEEYRYRWNEYRVKKGVNFLKEKLIELVEKDYLKSDIPQFKAGDTIEVQKKVK